MEKINEIKALIFDILRRQAAHQQEIQQLKEENMQLGLEVIYIFLYSLITSFIIID